MTTQAQELHIKEAVRARDGYRCTECQITQAQHVALTGRSLEVHRLQPGSEYTLAGCVTLCRKCHGPKPRRRPGSVPRSHVMVGLPHSLMSQVFLIAAAQGIKPAAYLDSILREAVARDLALIAEEMTRLEQPPP